LVRADQYLTWPPTAKRFFGRRVALRDFGASRRHFSEAYSNQSLWWGLFITVLTLTLIDGVESLATIAAIDKIDPFRRKSGPNRTLHAMGVSNLCSSLAGGLTIIPGGVKSGSEPPTSRSPAFASAPTPRPTRPTPVASSRLSTPAPVFA
jgi:hypothetical protein